jgi:RNA polymerase sigma-70 factor (ECF subfamily)
MTPPSIFARCLSGDKAKADSLARAAVSRVLLDPAPRKRDAGLETRIFAIVLELSRTGGRDPTGVGGLAIVEARGGAAADVSDLGRALMKLPRSQREALALVDGAGRSYDEAATLCGCAPGTIGSRISRGRSRLVEILADGRAGGGRRIPDRIMAALLTVVSGRSRASA